MLKGDILMADHKNNLASPKAVKDSQVMWENFIKISKICGILIAVILVLMALTLV
jgi:hypothetical protein